MMVTEHRICKTIEICTPGSRPNIKCSALALASSSDSFGDEREPTGDSSDSISETSGCNVVAVGDLEHADQTGERVARRHWKRLIHLSISPRL